VGIFQQAICGSVATLPMLAIPLFIITKKDIQCKRCILLCIIMSPRPSICKSFRY